MATRSYCPTSAPIAWRCASRRSFVSDARLSTAVHTLPALPTRILLFCYVTLVFDRMYVILDGNMLLWALNLYNPTEIMEFKGEIIAFDNKRLGLSLLSPDACRWPANFIREYQQHPHATKGFSYVGAYFGYSFPIYLNFISRKRC